jgi:hypothetical protein
VVCGEFVHEVGEAVGDGIEFLLQGDVGASLSVLQ